jgi:mycothiol synthase
MVAVRPGHQGKRLGYWVGLAAMHQMAREGARRAILRTDDFRIPAIKTYLRLGFEPLLTHKNQRQRWLAVLDEIGGGHAHAGLRDAVTAGPIYEL